MHFPKPKHIMLFGGSPLMVKVAKMLRERGYGLDIFTSPRQEVEPVGPDGESLGQVLTKAGMDWYITTNDINHVLRPDLIDAETMGIGLGEAWSFGKPILDAFGGRLLDFMGVPLPKYRGGAHYTWALMNNTAQWGCALQTITENTRQGEFDDGAMVWQDHHEVWGTTPKEWFDECNAFEVRSLEHFFELVEAGHSFTPWYPEEDRSVFFPRLNTSQQGWINWSWEYDDVASFIAGFDKPYPGAHTTINGQVVQLRGADITADEFHPFANGLIYRIEADCICIAAGGGSVTVSSVIYNGRDIIKSLKVGQRFTTTIDQLERALAYVPNYTPAGDSCVMKQDYNLIGKKVVLRPLSLADCTEEYVGWLNDPEVNKYLECRFEVQTVDSVRRFVQCMQSSHENHAFAIVLKEGMQHIGNIKIGGINPHHHYADIGYFIGVKFLWGRGLATEAIQLVTDHAFNDLELMHLRAGVYESNVGSIKALRKAGYTFEGIWNGHLQGANGREGHAWLTKTSPAIAAVS